ncbi:hypothetical protein [Vibrio sp. D431a]|uniref:hypothetical protein n=1 Tax=Vibrio sp. D431a TaxID=2837388 RepID=UPI002553DCFD|nr:hypothetical protein [Vibrio sp. D431a]MDK9790082.1 hypothetical protein [Vibrio sp. D431a]
MTTELRQVIVEDVRSKFGDDMVDRILNKDLIKSLADFYQTEDNYRKHSMGLPLNPTEWIESIKPNATGNLTNLFLSVLEKDEDIVFVVDNDKEAEVSRVAINAISKFLNNNNRKVTVVQKEPTEDAYNTIKKWVKSYGNESKPLNVVGVGLGFNSSLKDVGFENFGNIKQAFIDSKDASSRDDLVTSISTKNGAHQVGLSQILSTCFTDAMHNANEGTLSEEWGYSSLEKQLQELVFCEHQSPTIKAPASARTSDLESLTKYTELQSNYNFQESLGWAIGLKYTLGAAGVDDFHRMLTESGVNPSKFNDYVTAIFESNVSSNVIYDILEQAERSEIPLDDKGKPAKFSDVYSERIMEVVPVNLQQLSSKNALRSLREKIITLETKQNLSEIESSSLKQLKSLSFKLRASVKGLKDTLRESDAVDFIRSEDSVVAICKYKHGIEKYIDEGFLNSLNKKPLDGVLLSYPEVNDEASRIHLKIHSSSDVRDTMLDESMQFKMGGLEVTQPYKASPNVIQLSSYVRGRGVDDDSVRRFATSFNSIISKNVAKLTKNVDSVIIAEPDSLGQALELLNYVGAGHSNSVDPNVNLRIPKKMPLKVTVKGTGEQRFMTIDEITSMGVENFSTFEVLYTDPDPSKKASPKSLFVDERTIRDMANDIGKKRFYGPLRLGYSTNGVSGKLHIKGYDPAFSIRYKKDVVLKPNKQRHQTSDKFWADMRKAGQVERGVPEVSFKNVNGVDLNKHENFEVFKRNALEVIDRMNGGVPDTTGDAAYWCVDTETTGLSADADLLNFGAAGYSVVPDSGEEIAKTMIVKSLTGQQYVLNENSELEEITSKTELANVSSGHVIRVGEFGSQRMFRFNPKTLTKVNNVASIDGETAIVNRELQLDYISALVKTDEFTKVPTVIEELSGVSTEQIEKYGISISELENIFDRETSRFKSGNAFAIHNAPFDIGVMTRQSKKISNILNDSNNMVVDTRVMAGGDEPLLYNEPEILHSIKSTGAAPVEAKFADRSELLNFLKTASAGDRLEGVKGAIEISKTGLLSVFPTHQSPKGKGCKDFDKNDRSTESVMKVISESKSLTLPTIGDHRFENKSKLKTFLTQAVDGSKMSDMFGSGYIMFDKGALLSVKAGVAASSKVIANSEEDLLSMISTTQLNKTTTRTNMEALMGYQKVVDLIKSTMDVKLMSVEEILKFDEDLSEHELADLAGFVEAFDLSKTPERNLENYKATNALYVDESLMLSIGRAHSEMNAEIVYAYQNKSSLLKALKALDSERSPCNLELVEAKSHEIGVDANTVILASNILTRAKKGKLASRVFKDQSHCNAERYNSDVMTELMVATNMAHNKLGNSFSVEESLKRTTDAVANAAITASAAGLAQVTNIDVVTPSSAPIFTGNVRKSSIVSDSAHGLKKSISSGSTYDKVVADIETDRFNKFDTPNSYSKLYEELPLAIAALKVESNMFAKKASGFIDIAYDSGVMEVALGACSDLKESGISINGIGLGEEYRSVVTNITNEILMKAENGESIDLGHSLLTSVPKEQAFNVKRDVLNRINGSVGAARLLPEEKRVEFAKGISNSTKAIGELTDITGDLYNSLRDCDDVLVAKGNPLSSREQSVLTEAIFKTPYVRSKLSLLNTDEINSIRERVENKYKEQQMNAMRFTL